MEVGKAIVVGAMGVISLFLFSYGFSVTGLVAGTAEIIDVETNLPNNEIIGPSGIGIPIMARITLNGKPIHDQVTAAELLIDNQKVSDRFTANEDHLLLENTSATPALDDGIHALQLKLTLSNGRTIKHEQSLETDYTAPTSTIISRGTNSVFFSINDAQSQVHAGNVIAYYVDDSGEVVWASNELNCQTMEKQTDCELNTQVSLDNWVISFRDTANNHNEMVVGKNTLSQLHERATTRRMQTIRKDLSSMRDEDKALLSSGTCISPRIDYIIYHTTGEYPALGWTLQKKIDYARGAKQDIEDIYAHGFSSQGFGGIPFGDTHITIVVPTNTNLTGITGYDAVLHVSNSFFPGMNPTDPFKRCDNPYGVCFMRRDLGLAIGGTASGDVITTYKEAASPGSYETARKNTSNIVIAVVDDVAGASAQAMPNNGMAYLGFTKIYESGYAYLTTFSHRVAHEIGHLFGMADLWNSPSALMQSTGTAFATDMDFHTAKRVKTILCTDGQKADSLGVVQSTAVFQNPNSPEYGNFLLYREGNNPEQCEVNYAGKITPGSFTAGTHQDFFCVVAKDGSAIIDPPIWVTQQNVGNVIAQYPNAQILTCLGPGTSTPGKCVPMSGGNGPSTPTTRRPYMGSQDTVPIPPGGSCGGPGSGGGGNSTPACTRPTAGALCGSYTPNASGECPAAGWCPAGKTCSANGGACGCVAISTCGNGQIDAGETCDHGGPNGYACDEGGTCVKCDCQGGNPEPPEY